jgi:hypothetical protein
MAACHTCESGASSVIIVVDLSPGGTLTRRKCAEVMCMPPCPASESFRPLKGPGQHARRKVGTRLARCDLGQAGERMDALIHVVSLSFTSCFLDYRKDGWIKKQNFMNREY